MKKLILSLCSIGITLASLTTNTYAEGGKQGAYVSGQVGIVYNPVTLLADWDSVSSSTNIFAWGVNAGYNYQFAPKWLVGGQIGYTSLGSSSWSVPLIGSSSLDFSSINALASITRLIGNHWYI